MAIGLFAVAYGTNVAAPLLLVYRERLELSPLMVSALFGVYALGLVPALVFAAPASDVLGRRRIVVPAAILGGIASGLLLLGSGSVVLLFVGRWLLGVVSGAAFPAGTAWMQDLSEGEDSRSTARLLAVALYSGFGLGPLVSGALAQWFALPTILPYVVHIGLVGVALVAIRDVPSQHRNAGHRVSAQLTVPRSARRTFGWFILPAGLAVFGFSSLAYGLFPVLVEPFLGSISIFVTGLVAFLITVASVAAQSLARRLGHGSAVGWALLTGAAGVGVATSVLWGSPWYLLLPSGVLMGLASGLGLGAGLAMVTEIAEASRRGGLAGAFYAVAYGGMLAPVAVASVAGSDRYAVVFVGLAATAILGSAAVFVRGARDASAP